MDKTTRNQVPATGLVAGAVVIGADFQSLGVLRSLAEENVPVFQVEHETGIARYSRYSRRRVLNRQLLKGEGGLQFLLDLADREQLQGWTLFANDDETVKFLSIHRDALSACYRSSIPEWEIVQKFYVKQSAYEIAEQIGLSIPRMYTSGSLEEVLLKHPVFPLVLKPTSKEKYYTKTGKKAIRVNTVDALTREFTNMTRFIEPEQVVVQEMIEGGPKNLYSYATVFDGEKPLVGMSAHRLRQHPMDFGHATTYARSVHKPELQELATRLLVAIGYRGIAEVEFMWDDRDGCYKFIEINGRPWGWNTLAKASGVNIPYAMHRFLLGEEIPPAEPREDVRWVRMITDAPTAIMEMLKGRLTWKDYMTSLGGQREHAVFDKRDPLPSVMECLLLPLLWWRKGF